MSNEKWLEYMPKHLIRKKRMIIRNFLHCTAIGKYNRAAYWMRQNTKLDLKAIKMAGWESNKDKYPEIYKRFPRLDGKIAYAIEMGWLDSLEDMTCLTCPEVLTCKYAMSFYNTYGDCLAEK